MGRIAVCTGRGGVGKSTFVALASRYLDPPKLLIDLDPDESLADMLGVDWNETRKKTISSALHDIMKQDRGVGRTGYASLPNVLRPVVKDDCLYRSPEFDLLTLGTKFTVGCYCAPDAALRDLIPLLSKNYEAVLVDSPAGLEHLNRKVAADIDDLFVILDPSDKSVKHIQRVKDITGQLKFSYKNFYLVGNHRFTQEAQEYFQDTGNAYLGKLDFDPNVKQHNLEGRSLLELPDNSPAVVSVREILTKAGYTIYQRD